MDIEERLLGLANEMYGVTKADIINGSDVQVGFSHEDYKSNMYFVLQYIEHSGGLVVSSTGDFEVPETVIAFLMGKYGSDNYQDKSVEGFHMHTWTGIVPFDIGRDYA